MSEADFQQQNSEVPMVPMVFKPCNAVTSPHCSVEIAGNLFAAGKRDKESVVRIWNARQTVCSAVCFGPAFSMYTYAGPLKLRKNTRPDSLVGYSGFRPYLLLFSGPKSFLLGYLDRLGDFVT